jgi:hypothetical protein
MSKLHLPRSPQQLQIRQPNFGSGDAIVYPFGTVHWGDDNVQEVLPFNQTVTLTHAYKAAGTYTNYAFYGTQYKYDNYGWTGSYEACVDSNSVAVTVR